MKSNIILRIKRYIRRLLVYILKAMDIPRLFEEFTAQDMEQIHVRIITVINMNDIVGNLRSVRIDHNYEFHVLEYKRQKSLEVSFSDKNNPDASVNIRKDFKCITHGFTEKHTSMIHDIVSEYLKAHDFIR